MINLQAMDFKLKFTPKSPNQRFNYKQPMLLTGSCFADNIGDLLAKHQFNILSQPNGVVYNPISIAQQIKQIGEGGPLVDSSFAAFNLIKKLSETDFPGSTLQFKENRFLEK